MRKFIINSICLGLLSALALPLAAQWQESSALHVDGIAVKETSVFLSVHETLMDGTEKVVLFRSESAEAGPWTETEVASGTRLAAGPLWLSPAGVLHLFWSEEDELKTAQLSASGAISGKAGLGKGWASGAPVRLKDGTWVLPGLIPAELGATRPVVWTSADGMSWTLAEGPFSLPGQAPTDWHPQLVAHPDGSMTMYLRTRGTAYSYTARSIDKGAHWSVPLPWNYNPDHNLAVTELAPSRMLVLKSCRYDHKIYQLPNGVYAYLTRDGGKLWYGGLQLDGRQYAVDPVVTRAADGMVYAAWTWKTWDACEVLLAVTSEREIESAWGAWHQAPLRRSVVHPAGKAQEAFQRRIAGFTARKPVWTRPSLRIASYNIGFYGYTADPDWNTRLTPIRKLFEKYDFDVVGSQEPDTMMIRTMLDALGGRYACAGDVIFYPDRPGQVAPINPIFYKQERVELLDQGYLWLGDAPFKKGYDGYTVRDSHWAKFRDKSTGVVFFCFNSHFDHRGLEAKEYASDLLLDAVMNLGAGCPCFLTGDFNMTETAPGYRKLKDSPILDDAMLALPESKRKNAIYASWCNFKPLSTVAKNGLHLDHIFYTPATSKVLAWELITDPCGEVYGSDHLPIYMDWQLAEQNR